MKDCSMESLEMFMRSRWRWLKGAVSVGQRCCMEARFEESLC